MDPAPDNPRWHDHEPDASPSPDDFTETEPQRAVLSCPECDEDASDARPVNGLIQCPHCGRQFFAPASPEDELEPGTADEQREPAITPEGLAAEFDVRRIEQFTRLRRADIRARSHFVVAAGLCVVTAVQFVLMTTQFFRDWGWHAHPLVLYVLPAFYLIVATAAAVLLAYFLRRAVKLTRDLRQSLQKDPTSTPDFSGLDNGSQRWKNLEQLR